MDSKQRRSTQIQKNQDNINSIGMLLHCENTRGQRSPATSQQVEMNLTEGQLVDSEGKLLSIMGRRKTTRTTTMTRDKNEKLFFNKLMKAISQNMMKRRPGNKVREHLGSTSSLSRFCPPLPLPLPPPGLTVKVLLVHSLELWGSPPPLRLAGTPPPTPGLRWR